MLHFVISKKLATSHETTDISKNVSLLFSQFYSFYINDFSPIILFKLFLKAKGTNTEPGMTKADFLHPDTSEPADNISGDSFYPIHFFLSLSTYFPYHTTSNECLPFAVCPTSMSLSLFSYNANTWFLNTSGFGEGTSFLPVDYATLVFFYMDVFPYITKMSFTTCPPWQLRNFCPYPAQWQAWPLQTSGLHFLMRLPNKPPHYFPFKQWSAKEYIQMEYKIQGKEIICNISMLLSLVYQCSGHFTLKVLHCNSRHFQVSIPQPKGNLTKISTNRTLMCYLKNCKNHILQQNKLLLKLAQSS